MKKAKTAKGAIVLPILSRLMSSIIMCKIRNEKWAVYSFDYLLVILIQILITAGIVLTNLRAK